MDSAQIQELEAFERAMYRDSYAAASPRVVEELGLVVDERRCGLLLSAGNQNHPFFNRVMLAERPAEDALREIEAHFASIGRRVQDALDAGISTIVSETDEELPDRPNPSTRNLIRHGLPIVYVRPNLGPAPPDQR